MQVGLAILKSIKACFCLKTGEEYFSFPETYGLIPYVPTRTHLILNHIISLVKISIVSNAFRLNPSHPNTGYCKTSSISWWLCCYSCQNRSKSSTNTSFGALLIACSIRTPCEDSFGKPSASRSTSYVSLNSICQCESTPTQLMSVNIAPSSEEVPENMSEDRLGMLIIVKVEGG